jgi:8-oxo-dGTP diphosphatase
MMFIGSGKNQGNLQPNGGHGAALPKIAVPLGPDFAFSPMPMKRPYLRVACAIIERAGLVLVAQRGPGMDLAGQWEFPGGKVQPGETDAACLVREIAEELGVQVAIVGQLPDRIHHYPGKTVCLVPFVARLVGGEPVPTEHQRIGWFTLAELRGLDWCAADLPVLGDYLEKEPNLRKA